MKDEHDNMKKYIFDMSLGWIIKVYLANLVAGVLAMCLFGNVVNAYIIIYTACLFGISFFTVHEGVASVNHTIMYSIAATAVLIRRMERN